MDVSIGETKKDCNLCDNNHKYNFYCVSVEEKSMKEVKNNVEEDLSEDEMLIDGVCESGEDDTACESDSIRNDELWEVKNMLG